MSVQLFEFDSNVKGIPSARYVLESDYSALRDCAEFVRTLQIGTEVTPILLSTLLVGRNYEEGKTNTRRNTMKRFIVVLVAFLSFCCVREAPPQPQKEKPIEGSPSYPATELTQTQAREAILGGDQSFTVVHYSQVKHIIKVGKGVPYPDGSYSLDYKTLEQADQLAPNNGEATPPSCDCANGTHSWFCACDPKHKILIVGVPDCCEGYCGAYGILIWCSGGCNSVVATCSDAFGR